MSTLEQKPQGIEFKPVVSREKPPVDDLTLVIGVIVPAIVIAIELGTRLCATAFFDPMPTIWHTLAVALVPASNLLLWMQLRNGLTVSTAKLAFANGAAMGIAALYALLFLPLLPLAIMALIIFVGALPLSPLMSLVAAVQLRRALSRATKTAIFDRPFMAGLAAGLAVLLVLDVPAAATRLGLQWAASSQPAERQRGIALLRTLGDEELLRRLCYDATGRPTGLLSAFVLFSGRGLLDPEQARLASSPAEAREIYYRVTGMPFNAKAPPHSRSNWARFDDFMFDADHGGAAVGGRIKGLDIVSSRLDGSISGSDGVAYLEWTAEFRNTSVVDREARLQLALPPGGVVSRATLWVNGEEREAAYGGRAEVRAAYQRVAVQQRKDPLLVTTKGADRVLVQAFPVGRNGGTIKFKVGVTAPLDMSDPAGARLTLPAIIDRNFSFPSGSTHQIWIEGKERLNALATGLAASEIASGQFRLQGALTDKELAHPRMTIQVASSATAGPVHAWIGDGPVIRQEVGTGSSSDGAAAMMLVVDGSARMKPIVADIIAALEAIPMGARVGAMIAAEPPVIVEPKPWSSDQKTAVGRLLRSHAFVGGEDNALALGEALLLLERETNGSLLWIHGPQPVMFRGSAARLEQATTRLARLASVTLYGVEPGPVELLPDAPWAWGARTLPTSASPAADLSAHFTRELGARGLGDKPTPNLVRTETKPDPALTKGSDHIVRLWAKDRILHLMGENQKANRQQAVDLAVQYRLVTPVSGAVVLETKQQYDESRLTPVSQATVPTIPEPHEWALLLLVIAAVLWMIWSRRRFDVAAT